MVISNIRSVTSIPRMCLQRQGQGARMSLAVAAISAPSEIQPPFFINVLHTRMYMHVRSMWSEA